MEFGNKKELEKLHEKFFEVASLFPNNVALTHCNGIGLEISVSYEELNTLSLKVRKVLRENILHDSFESVVYAICTDSGIPAIIFMLSVLGNDSAFYYISPDSTDFDLVNIAKKIPLKFMIIQKDYEKKVPGVFNPVTCKNLKILNDDFLLISIYFSDVDDEQRFHISNQYSFAYVICTSGSTGTPKIVCVPHECIVPNIKDFQAIFNITSSDTLLSTSPFYFDPSIVDIFLGISYGARVLIMSPIVLKTPNLLEFVMKTNPISFIQITPALFKTLSSNVIKELVKNNILRAIALGGEMFPNATSFEGWFNLHSKIKIYNLYGLTELSCWASCYEVNVRKYLSSDTQNSVPIGEPLSGVEILLTDKYGNKITKGKGNIIITGKRNICHIIDHSFPTHKSGWPINTGDIGYSDGINLFCIGRYDDIIKRNACKISLMEIEIISRKLEGVSECCALYYENKILLFVATVPAYVLTKNIMKSYLKNSLSSWKLPDEIIFIKCLPLNRNFKVDRALLLTNYAKIVEAPKQALTDPAVVEEFWKDFTGFKPKEMDNFIHVGGNSLQAVQFAQKIQSLMVYENPLILQAILNQNYEDICSLVIGFKKPVNSALPDEIITVKNIESMSRNCHSIPSHFGQGGHYVYTAQHLSLLSKEFDIKWTVFLGKCVDSSPLVIQYKHHIKIFIGSHSRNFMCVTGEGKLIWKTSLSDRIEGAACLSKSGDEVYVGCYDGRLYCFEVKNGTELWTVQTRGKIKNACSVDQETGCIIFGSYDKYLYCCDESGNLKWKTQPSTGSLSSTSVIADSFIFIGTLDGYIVCLEKKTGNIKWKKCIGKPIFGSLAVCSRGVVFGCTDNFIYCVNFNSEISWKYETEGPIFSSPSVLEHDYLSIIAVGSHDFNLYVLDIQGNKIGIYHMTSTVYSTPFIVLGDKITFYIFVAETGGLVHGIKFKKEERIWRKKSQCVKNLHDKIFSSPVFHDGKLYIGCRNNMLFCLGI